MSPMTRKIDEDGIWSTMSIDRAALAALAPIAERQNVYMQNKPVDKQGNKIDQDEEQSTAEELVDTHLKYAVGLIVFHVVEGENVLYFVHWYGYTPVDDVDRLHEHILEHLIPQYWRRIRKNDAMRQPRGRAHVNRWAKVLN